MDEEEKKFQELAEKALAQMKASGRWRSPLYIRARRTPAPRLVSAGEVEEAANLFEEMDVFEDSLLSASPPTTPAPPPASGPAATSTVSTSGKGKPPA